MVQRGAHGNACGIDVHTETRVETLWNPRRSSVFDHVFESFRPSVIPSEAPGVQDFVVLLVPRNPGTAFLRHTVHKPSHMWRPSELLSKARHSRSIIYLHVPYLKHALVDLSHFVLHVVLPCKELVGESIAATNAFSLSCRSTNLENSYNNLHGL